MQIADKKNEQKKKEYNFMDKYFWPGAYSFKFELRALLEGLKEQIDIILYKIDKADKMAQKCNL